MEQTDHILIVDADADTRSLLTRYLQKYGLQAPAVTDGHAMRQALDDATLSKPFSPRELLACIHTLCGAFGVRRALLKGLR